MLRIWYYYNLPDNAGYMDFDNGTDLIKIMLKLGANAKIIKAEIITEAAT